ncbi:hypothetical protein, partial [Hyalangium sp.]|uniref:hypothetical protein n=1 Tax=Hyalangium sp. TaxID=2028555 RepID=UPI002D3837B2
HGRLDTLWRPEPSDKARILIVGGGSSGVVRPMRAPQPLSYNILSAEPCVGAWTIRVSTRQLPESMEPGIKPSEYHSYSAVVGQRPTSAPFIFHGDRTDNCHRAIAHLASRKGDILRNFISIVESPEYSHPSTAKVGQRMADMDDVEKSFKALHPEWEPTQREPNLAWRPHADVHTHGYKFQHGPLMFGLPLSKRAPDALGPVQRALASLDGNSRSRAYVPVAHVDLTSPDAHELLTGLTGIQFIEDEKEPFLDLVATFRKLELSFWWAVNMYECCKLLQWAATQRRNKKPRRITFFAALAEWKPIPEIPSIAEFDTLGLEGLTRIAFQVSTRDISAKAKLARLLQEKADYTNDINIDHSGIRTLVQIIRGIRGSTTEGSAFSSVFLEKLVDADVLLEDALQSPNKRGTSGKLTRAKTALNEAASYLVAEGQAS